MVEVTDQAAIAPGTRLEICTQLTQQANGYLHLFTLDQSGTKDKDTPQTKMPSSKVRHCMKESTLDDVPGITVFYAVWSEEAFSMDDFEFPIGAVQTGGRGTKSSPFELKPSRDGRFFGRPDQVYVMDYEVVNIVAPSNKSASPSPQQDSLRQDDP